VVDADLILVLDGGQVIESGTHFELMNKHDSRYSKMWALQATPAPGKTTETDAEEAEVEGAQTTEPAAAEAPKSPASPSDAVNASSVPRIEPTPVSPPANAPPST
jgi:ABC-type glutathione transport system ATPase component